MKTFELYQCEICGTQYKLKGLCEKCEKSHIKDLKIEKMRYLPLTEDKTGMPITITIIGPDGRHYTYKR